MDEYVIFQDYDDGHDSGGHPIRRVWWEGYNASSDKSFYGKTEREVLDQIEKET